MSHPFLCHSWQGRTVLLLQGPIGPFFRRLGRWLERQGARVLKVNFNAGDRLFYPKGILYREPIDALSSWLNQIVDREHITDFVVFGDCRPVHVEAKAVACAREIEFWVFEEGYFRPHFITCERGGVNGYSRIKEAVDSGVLSLFEPFDETKMVFCANSRTTYQKMAFYAALYWSAAALGRWQTPHYQHHRPIAPLIEGPLWLKGYLKKPYLKFRDEPIVRDLTGTNSKNFLLVALQTHQDAQIVVHSSYWTIEQYIGEVLYAYARSESPHLLVFKHHPMDRAYKDYRSFIERLAQKMRIEHRVKVLYDAHLPTLLSHCAGVVTINSTAGLAALEFGCPTHVDSGAFYSLDGVTHTGDLKTFLEKPEMFAPDREKFLRFKNYVLTNTQINDNFYAPITESKQLIF